MHDPITDSKSESELRRIAEDSGRAVADRLRAVIACPTCYGEGVVVDTLGYGPEVREREVPCPECGEGPA